MKTRVINGDTTAVQPDVRAVPGWRSGKLVVLGSGLGTGVRWVPDAVWLAGG